MIAHPLFQGPYHLSTSVGDVSVTRPDHPIDDPTGAGRTRHITLAKSGRFGERTASGVVKWESQYVGEFQNAGYGQKAEMPSHGRDGEKRQEGMVMRSLTGDIKLTF